MSLKFYFLPPSPNNTKVMVTCAYKNIPYESVLVMPTERAAVIAATGQPLTPAMVHDGTKLFDSTAIMRYLDANFPGPRLWSEDYTQMKAIEGWERFARFEVGHFVGRIFGQLFAETKDMAEVAAVNKELNELTGKIEAALEDREWLVGDSMTAADIMIGCRIGVACLNDEEAAQTEYWGVLQSLFDIGPGRERTRALCHRVLAYLPSFATLAK